MGAGPERKQVRLDAEDDDAKGTGNNEQECAPATQQAFDFAHDMWQMRN